MPVPHRLLASAYYCKKLCLLCDGEHKAAMEAHKSMPALCLRLEWRVKTMKPSFCHSLSRLYRKTSSRLLLNSLVRAPGRCDGCTPHLVTESRETAPASRCGARGNPDCAPWKPGAPEGRERGPLPLHPHGSSSCHEVAVFRFHSSRALLDITFVVPRLFFFLQFCTAWL